VNSVLIAGGRNFINGDIIEITTCLLALTTGIIQALRTFFKIDENRENCLTTYKDLFRLFCEISIVLDQPRTTRGVDPQKFMADKTSEYKEIMNKAIVLEYKKADRDPIYHDRHPWMLNYDMIPDVSTPSTIDRLTISTKGGVGLDPPAALRRPTPPVDVGLPLVAGDSVELDKIQPILEEEDSSSDDEEAPKGTDDTSSAET
jgi:hypothetical protein